MNVRRSTLALVAGLVSFLVVATALTELLSTLVWPSAIVSLPAGVLVGVAGFGVTYYLLSRRALG